MKPVVIPTWCFSLSFMENKNITESNIISGIILLWGGVAFISE